MFHACAVLQRHARGHRHRGVAAAAPAAPGGDGDAESECESGLSAALGGGHGGRPRAGLRIQIIADS